MALVCDHGTCARESLPPAAVWFLEPFGTRMIAVCMILRWVGGELLLRGIERLPAIDGDDLRLIAWWNGFVWGTVVALIAAAVVNLGVQEVFLLLRNLR
ncbi:hypothetical protein [Nitrospira calida]|jgi:hypothetical protein